ncbi:maleylpyruvate isomerase N-terminal domain-containing protein [Streptomyces sp. NPDC050287]|uniref:maleylpyruvate isomerase N-terminal domain-containing protein n=1 Tax=Streptomyces sp. NPDC050287 TaxID=3365608 RepID=UPI0037962A31
MSGGWPGPEEVAPFIERIENAQTALAEQVRGLTDDQVADASLLPGWTRGHVLTHLARHADATTRMVEGAARGEVVPQYEGGAQGRVEEIERGASRPAADQVLDLIAAGKRCLAALHAAPPEAWERPVAGDVPATKALVSRWREVEIHRVDLRMDFTPEDWTDEFIKFLLPRELPRLADRSAGTPVPEGLPEHAVLAWLIGRGEPGLPELPAWA